MSAAASTWFLMLLLAVVQGLAEFLPISSSGHLALIQWFAGVGEASIAEDVILHGGTLIAVIMFYRESILALLRGIISGAAGARRYALLLIVGNIPAGIVGIFFRDQLERLFSQPYLILAAMALTGVWLARSRGLRQSAAQPQEFDEVNLRTALLMGVAQAGAILPGASRSGWTIVTGMRLGLAPAAAARFSFLLSVPAIGGAMLLSLGDIGESEVGLGPLAMGFVISGLVGYWSLRWLVQLACSGALYRFAPYLWALCAVAGVAVWLRS